ncbi:MULTISPECIES: hypothetical protein [unclassified Caballeronia]|uniref:hypothetical protein n=1 Tax=unclassified Caballeronia TaxID=2646786 RepID=UPI0020292B7E|nr:MULTISPECIES: hypothetical protein [unclassified Caballeronia]
MIKTILNVRLIDDDGQCLIAWNTENLSTALNAENVDQLIVGLVGLREQIAPPVSTAGPRQMSQRRPSSIRNGGSDRKRLSAVPCSKFAIPDWAGLHSLSRFKISASCTTALVISSHGQKSAPPDEARTEGCED